MADAASPIEEFRSSGNLQLIPGVSFGPFDIGSDIDTVVEELRSDASRFGNVEVDVDHLQPLNRPLTLKIPRMDTSLRFDSRVHRLEEVMVSDLHRCGEIMYKGKVFCSGRSMPPTFTRIYDVLGPTFRGEMRDDGRYILRYPGISIGFRIPAEHRAKFAASNANDGAHPIVLSDGSTPVAETLSIRMVSPEDPANVVRPKTCTGLPLGADVIASAKGVTVGTTIIPYGCSPQDLIHICGPPRTITPKRDDRLEIHNPASRQGDASTPCSGPYFYNYPELGMDFAFNGKTHSLEKVICFNAVPPSESFLRYARCHFAIDATMMCSNPLPVPLVLNGNTVWSEFAEGLQRNDAALPQPLLATTRNGVVRMYSFVGVVVDVLETGRIGKVTLFRASPGGTSPAPSYTVKQPSPNGVGSAVGASPVSDYPPPPYPEPSCDSTEVTETTTGSDVTSPSNSAAARPEADGAVFYDPHSEPPSAIFRTGEDAVFGSSAQPAPLYRAPGAGFSEATDSDAFSPMRVQQTDAFVEDSYVPASANFGYHAEHSGSDAAAPGAMEEDTLDRLCRSALEGDGYGEATAEEADETQDEDGAVAAVEEAEEVAEEAEEESAAVEDEETEETEWQQPAEEEEEEATATAVSEAEEPPEDEEVEEKAAEEEDDDDVSTSIGSRSVGSPSVEEPSRNPPMPQPAPKMKNNGWSTVSSSSKGSKGKKGKKRR